MPPHLVDTPLRDVPPEMIRLMSDLIEIREGLWKMGRRDDAMRVTQANVVFNIRSGRSKLEWSRPQVLRLASDLGRIGGELTQAGRITQAATIQTAIEYLTTGGM